jgi:hypothetical protein
MKRKHIWLVGLFAVVALFLYPFPSTGFLYRHAPVLEGKIANLKGASVVLFLDPSFYYKFKIAPADFAFAVSALGLTASTSEELAFNLRTMKSHGPWFWNSWWWRPERGPVSQLYTGYRAGNRFYFLYDGHTRFAYLYIQNT